MKGIGQRIRRAREVRGLSQEQLAKAVGIAQQTLAKLEAEPERGTKHILAFARALGQEPEWLETGKGTMHGEGFGTLAPVEQVTDFAPITVIGAVQAGVWREALEWEREERYAVNVPVAPAFAGKHVFGLEVRGPSMNEIYPNRSVVFCVPFVELNREPRSGERVVVYRRSKGELMEATLKEYWTDEKGTAWLRPRSTHPDFQKAWRVGDGKPDHEFEVHALVIGSWRPEA